MTLLVVVAHPDDETFGCGSILLHARRRTRTVVVCATRGEAGELAPGVARLADGQLATLREQELRSAATLLGVDHVEVLGLLDSGMDGPPPPGSVCGIPATALAEQIRHAIARHAPTVVVTLDGSDGHRDHIRVRDAVLDAVSPDLPLYLHCLPRSLMHAWLRTRAGNDSDPYAALPDIGTPQEDITTILDTHTSYPQRCAAIQVHQSQTSPFEDLPEDLRRAFLQKDHLRRIQPPPLENVLESDLLGLD